MSIWGFVSVFLCVVIIIRSAQNLHNLHKSFDWLQDKHASDSKNKTRFFVCIPVLNEQDTIIKTIETFIKQVYPGNLISIYIATSAKEVPPAGEPTTKEVVDTYVASLAKTTRNRIHTLQYPEKDGYMAHQINFVADTLRDELEKDGGYFVVYNADSHIDKNVFKVVDYMITNTTNLTGKKPTILQQSSIYQYSGISPMAEGAGLHQTLWTLTHEIPKLLKQPSKLQRLRGLGVLDSIKSSRIAHCVGHGLFVRGDYYTVHPLPQNVLNEDLPYGLHACALRESIYPIPSLELASTPSRIMDVYHQKATWFNPFFEFISYGKSLIRQKSYVSRFEVWWLLAQAYGSLLIWLVHSFVLVGGLIASVMAGWVYVVLWAISFALYWLVPAFVVTGRRGSLDNGGSNSYAAILGGIPYVLSHSVGPLISVCRWLVAGIRGTKPLKRRTRT